MEHDSLLAVLLYAAGLSTATAADLTYNRLSCLPVTICQLTRLSSLKLSHNCLQDTGIPWNELCSALSSSLNVLQLGNNQLQQLPTCLGHLKALKHLQLAGNRLQQIDTGALQNLVQLEELQLQNNQLQQLPQDIGMEPCLDKQAKAHCFTSSAGNMAMH